MLNILHKWRHTLFSILWHRSLELNKGFWRVTKISWKKNHSYLKVNELISLCHFTSYIEIICIIKRNKIKILYFNKNRIKITPKKLNSTLPKKKKFMGRTYKRTRNIEKLRFYKYLNHWVSYLNCCSQNFLFVTWKTCF